MVRVSADTDEEDVARIIASRRLLAVPVVDSEGTLVGEVSVDDVIDVIMDEAAEDMYGLAGLDKGDGVSTPLRESARMRAPWLILNLVTAFLAALVVSRFEATIGRFAVLLCSCPSSRGWVGTRRHRR